MSRFNLDKPRTKVVSPLKEYKIPKFAGRRKFKRWSVEEEDALREGVKMYAIPKTKICPFSFLKNKEFMVNFTFIFCFISSTITKTWLLPL